MNERIQELLIEAHKQTKGGIYSGHLSEWTEKFAKLIVRECINIGDNYEEILGNEPECFNCRKVAYGIVDKIKILGNEPECFNCRKVAYGIVDKIKQHFGVEE